MSKTPQARRGLRGFAYFTWWQKTLLVLGCLAIGILIMSLFLSSDRLSGDIYSKQEIPPPDSQEFIEAISHFADASPEHGSDAEILNNGDQFLDRLLADINIAEKNITFTNFIWHEGEFSDRLFSALIERQRNGARVLLLLDDSGVSRAPEDDVKELKSAGGEVEYFRTPRLTRVTRLHKRNHRRAIVIDGRIGYVGGIAVDDAWLGNADQPDKWHDTMTRFEGPAVEHIQNGFAELWTATTGEILDSSFYNDAQNGGSATTLSFISSPAPDTQKLPVVFWYSFASAKRSIHITSPYFLPPPPLLKILQEKARQGVDVRIILPSNLTDSKSVRLASQSNYEPLLEAGVRIFEYQQSRMHAKQFVVDGSWTVVGSANMDSRSFLLNEENVMGVQSKDFGSTVEEMFEMDIASSDEITREEWAERDLGLRALQYLAKLFQKQL